MQIQSACPQCGLKLRCEVTAAGGGPQCAACGWSRPVGQDELPAGKPARCLICGCRDLWRQKDFPPALGLGIVFIGIVASSIAVFYYRPLVAIGVLMACALADLLLFQLKDDVLVCYRCKARHRHVHPGEQYPVFNLDVAERYRQEAHRLKEAR